jgi:hypothetical protein
VIQLVLPLNECATEPLQDVVESVADPATIEAATDPATAESVGFGATLTETFCLCVRF